MAGSGAREIIELATQLGSVLSEDQASLMLAHLDAVLEANTRLNLTAIADRNEAIRLHIADSLALLEELAAQDGRVADIGSGAGYPAIPIAIATGHPIDMIESVKKKAAFLTECVSELGGLWGSKVLPMRAEEAALRSAGEYQHVTARALTSLPALVELASPLLAVGGSLWAMKGAPTIDELESGSAAALLVGMRETGRREYRLPIVEERRMIVSYEKVSEPAIPLPRRVGLAQKKPLA
jgi:16S rRNA (guanine527-N7)-methyltransferase